MAKLSVIRSSLELSSTKHQHITPFVFHISFVVSLMFLCCSQIVCNRHNIKCYTIRPAIRLSQNTCKWARHVKNKKCMASYIAPLFSPFRAHFSLFAFHSISHQVGIRTKTHKISWFIFSRH